jgi:hypothetical protein
MVLLAEACDAELDVVPGPVPSQSLLTSHVTRSALIGRAEGIIVRRTVEIGAVLMEKER